LCVETTLWRHDEGGIVSGFVTGARGRPGEALARLGGIRNLDLLVGLLAVLVFIAIGFLLPWNTQVVFVAVACILCLAAVGSPTTYWVLAALISSFTFQGLATLGLLPSLGTVLPIAISWGALAVALLKSRAAPIPRRARPHLRWLIAFSLVTIVSGLFNHVEILRPFLFIGLLGVPFALVAAMLVDPPNVRERALLVKTTLTLILLQIPVVLWQFALGGGRNYGGSNLQMGGDRVQGTFISRGGGSGALAAIALIGALWLLARRRTLSHFALAAVLMVFPFISDSKQVLFALPVAVVATIPQGLTLGYFFRSGLAIGLLAILLFVLPVGRATRAYIQQPEQHGGDPKVQMARWLWNDLSADPVSLTFGKGPAETVSLAAYYTTPGFLSATSPFHALGLSPAQMAIDADYLAYGVVNNEERSSFQSAVSSALGVFGDLGLAGILTYGGLLITLLIALAGSRSPEGIAAMSGIGLFAVLGFIYGWWESPGLPAFVGVLAGIALTDPASIAVTRTPATMSKGDRAAAAI
jgi:hypothetical protein